MLKARHTWTLKARHYLLFLDSSKLNPREFHSYVKNNIVNIFQSIYYHATILLLFRPFFRKEIIVLKETPRDICRRAANDIISLSTQYRKFYTLRQTVINIPQIIFGASIILLMDLPSPSPAQAVSLNLIRSLKDLKELSRTWQWCNLTLRHIGELADKWNIDLPNEVLYAPHIHPRSLGNHDFINIGHVIHEFPNDQFHVLRPRSENPPDAMVNQPGNAAWLNDEDYHFVNSMIAFPGGFEDWANAPGFDG